DRSCWVICMSLSSNEVENVREANGDILSLAELLRGEYRLERRACQCSALPLHSRMNGPCRGFPRAMYNSAMHTPPPALLKFLLLAFSLCAAASLSACGGARREPSATRAASASNASNPQPSPAATPAD